ncbi:MAG: flagellar hook-length control protein FliK [Clostridiales bacterium]|jgi:flagellar hook-length control protein FliK|nr:flagellar hook-length control protein FliK [Clostridiales bacterium]
MTVTELFGGAIGGIPSAASVRPVRPEEGFGEYLGRVQTEKQSANRADATKERAGQPKTDEAAEKPETEAQAEKPSRKPPVKRDGGEKKQEDDGVSQEIIEKLAAALGLPAEIIMQALAAVSARPLELIMPEKLAAFAARVAEVSAETDPESAPTAADTADITNNILAGYNDAAEASAVRTKPDGKADAIGKPNFIRADTAEAPVTDADAEDPAERPAEDPARLPSREAAAPASVEKPRSESGEEREYGPDAAFIQETPVRTANVIPAVSARAPEPAADIPAAAPDIPKDPVAQVIDRLKVEYRGDTREVRVTLRPESLGDVTMRITERNGVVTAQFVAENQRVKETLEAGFNSLREELSRQGVNIQSMSVSVGGEKAGGRDSRSGYRPGYRRRLADTLAASSGYSEAAAHTDAIVNYTA